VGFYHRPLYMRAAVDGAHNGIKSAPLITTSYPFFLFFFLSLFFIYSHHP
jgi:hypothetical protein